LGISTTSGSKSETTPGQYKPHAALPSSPSQHTTPPPCYKVLGANVRVRRHERLDCRLLTVLSSHVQRRAFKLRHAPPRQSGPGHVVSSAACSRCQPSERGKCFDVEHWGVYEVLLKDLWTLQKLVAGDSRPRCGEHTDPESVRAGLGVQGARAFGLAFWVYAQGHHPYLQAVVQRIRVEGLNLSCWV